MEDLVYAQNYGPGAKWLPGQVSGTLGSTMFEAMLIDGRKVRRQADQLRSRAPAVVVTQVVNGNSDEEDDFDVRIPNTKENTETSTNDTDMQTFSNLGVGLLLTLMYMSNKLRQQVSIIY